MFVSGKSIVAQPLSPKPMQQASHSENNKITEKGCQQLAKAKWTNLRELWVGTNKVAKVRMVSEIGAVGIFLRLVGPTSKGLAYVQTRRLRKLQGWIKWLPEPSEGSVAKHGRTLSL